MCELAMLDECGWLELCSRPPGGGIHVHLSLDPHGVVSVCATHHRPCLTLVPHRRGVRVQGGVGLHGGPRRARNHRTTFQAQVVHH